MNATEYQAIAIMQAAVNSRHGITVPTNDPQRCRLALYATRRLVGDVEFNKLIARVSPDNSEGELWLVKDSVQLLDLKATEISGA